jgi:hypothetical protein
MTIAISVALVLASAGAGCGGGGSSSNADSSRHDGSGEGDTPTLSKAAFVKKANEACLAKRRNALELVAAYQKSHPMKDLSPNERARKAIKTVEVSVIAAEIDALQDLPAPEGDKQEVKALISEQQASLEDARQHLNELSRDIEASYTKANKRLVAYGLDGCTKGTG